MNGGIYFAPIIFFDLNKPWETVLSIGTPVSFPAKTIVTSAIFKSCSAGMYYIKKGCIRLSNIGYNGQTKVMLYLGRGNLFNEIPMLQHSYDFIFTTMEPTEAVYLPRQRITKDFIRENPELFFNLLESLTKKTQSFYSQLCVTHSVGSFNNVCRLLYSMHLFNRERGIVVPRLTQLELAAFLGIHRSSLHKSLTRLKDEGIIGTYSKTSLDILSPEKLLSYVSGEDAGNCGG